MPSRETALGTVGVVPTEDGELTRTVQEPRGREIRISELSPIITSDLEIADVSGVKDVTVTPATHCFVSRDELRRLRAIEGQCWHYLGTRDPAQIAAWIRTAIDVASDTQNFVARVAKKVSR